MRKHKSISPQMHVICDLCGHREKTKRLLVEHLKTCAASRTCNWCNMVFKNRGNLFSHSLHIHGKRMSKVTEKKRVTTPSSYTCSVCPRTYTQITNLKYHIRRDHFNLMSRVLQTEHRQLNEVWLERVLNSDALVEIRKATSNMYLMRKVTNDRSLQISEPIDSIDLTPLYPTHARRNRVWCDLCKKTCYQRDFQKHMNEKHAKITRHKCNNCNRMFKRPYLYLKHVCSKMKKKRWPAFENQSVDQITVND